MALTLVVSGLLTTGCNGWARLNLISTELERISKSAPLVVELSAAECYYSIEAERITIALTDENISLTGEYGKRSLVTSIVLEGLPAYQSRDYRLDRNSVRGKYRRGPKHVRFASLGGILGLWLEGDNQLKGRLRAFVKQQQFHVLRGWSGNRRVLLVGDFVAVRNRERTEELLRRSEADGMERGVPVRAYGKPRAVTGPPVQPPIQSQP